MRFVLASYGSRGDVEPCAAIGRELLRRGHEVRMAVPPDQVAFAESVGLAAVAYGLDTRPWIDAATRILDVFIPPLLEDPGSDQVGAGFLGVVQAVLGGDQRDADVAGGGGRPAVHRRGFRGRRCQHRGVLRHSFDHAALRPDAAQRPRSCAAPTMTVVEWVVWRIWKKVEDAQRRELGLPKAKGPWPRRIAERGSLEIQAYDEVCFPGLAAGWAKWDGQRPFVGALTMELPTDADEEVASWIAAGTPPIFFGFGSMQVDSPADTLAMIGAACAQLGERALVCAGWSDFSDVPGFEHVKVVGAVNYAAIFPACRAVVHHGGAGTTAAGLRAGVPTLDPLDNV